MKIVKIFLFISIALSARSGFAQYTMFPKTGTITFDKTVYLQNMLKKQLYAKAEGMTKNWYDQISNKLPGNVVLKNTLKFNNDETLFEYVKTDISEIASSFMENHAIKGDGTVYTNLKTKEYKRYQDFLVIIWLSKILYFVLSGRLRMSIAILPDLNAGVQTD